MNPTLQNSALKTRLAGGEGRRGSALLIVVSFLAALTVLLGSFLAAVRTSLAQQHEAWREQTVQALAEAGIAVAKARLAVDGDYSGERNVALGDGFYSVIVSRGQKADERDITAIGELRDGTRILHERRVAVQVRIK